MSKSYNEGWVRKWREDDGQGAWGHQNKSLGQKQNQTLQLSAPSFTRTLCHSMPFADSRGVGPQWPMSALSSKAPDQQADRPRPADSTVPMGRRGRIESQSPGSARRSADRSLARLSEPANAKRRVDAEPVVGVQKSRRPTPPGVRSADRGQGQAVWTPDGRSE